MVSFDQPLPLESLGPDNFERFCCDFLSKHNPAAKVHLFGGPGDKQHGVDIEATLQDGTILTYQCKRHKTFGPADVKKAVEAHTRRTNKATLLLARVASPQTRDEIAKHKDWELWDQEDISREFRQLPKIDQIWLVDRFFPGQRFPLIGVEGAGAWASVEDFFSPFLDGELAFNHKWDLVGREAELKELASHIANTKTSITYLTGPGGIGKSRLLYQALVDYQNKKTETRIRVASPSEKLSKAHLEHLGTGDKLLVVDDAHDHDDLQVLLEYIANPKNCARAILSLRAYGIEPIKRQAGLFPRLTPPDTAQIALKPLSRKQLIELSKQVINKYGGDESRSEIICKYIGDCTLSVILASKILSTNNLHIDLLNTNEEFRSTISSRFWNILTGELVEAHDKPTLQAILRVLALVQPFSPDDKTLYKLLETVESISIADSNRLIRKLIEGGVAFKRGETCRLAPDLLADHILEEACVTAGGASSGYAEILFPALPPPFVGHILLNLGRLDWRRSSGNTDSSRLLDGLWEKLPSPRDCNDQIVEAITPVAYYQPAKALQYTKQCISEKQVTRHLPKLIKNAAYSIQHVQDSCEYLWKLAKSKENYSLRYQESAICILKELCTPSPNTPIEYISKVVQFGLSLLHSPDSWSETHTPYDFLGAVLQTQGYATLFDGDNLLIDSYLTNPEAVSSLRQGVISAAIERLDSIRTEVAILSAQILSNALSYPITQKHIPNELHNTWTHEFINTLESIKRKIIASTIDPFVWLELLSSISWHATYAKGNTRDIARQIFDLTPDNLEFRAISVFVGTYKYFLIQSLDIKENEKEWQKILQNTSKEIANSFHSSEEIIRFIVSILEKIDNFKPKMEAYPENFLHQLLTNINQLPAHFLEYCINNQNSTITKYAYMALPKIYADNIQKGTYYTSIILDSKNKQLYTCLAKCLGEILNASSFTEYELSILQEFLSADDKDLVTKSLDALHCVAAQDTQKALELLKIVNFCGSEHVAESTLWCLSTCMPTDPNRPNLLDSGLAKILLDKLSPIPKLNGARIKKFLATVSAKHPWEALSFFKRRCEHAAATKDHTFYPCYYGLPTPLQFVQSAAYDEVYEDLWSWLRSREDDDYNSFYPFACRLLGIVISPITDKALYFMRKKFSGSPRDVFLIGEVLQHVNKNFSFENQSFVVDYLTVAQSHGRDCLEDAIGALYRATTYGYDNVAQVVRGEPFPRDPETLEKSESALKTLQPSSPAYRLYEMIKEDSEIIKTMNNFMAI